MTTLELYEFAKEKSSPRRVGHVVSKLVAGLVLWRARRRTLLKLATFDAAQLADIGLEPQDVEDALDGDAARLWSKIAAHNAST